MIGSAISKISCEPSAEVSQSDPPPMILQPEFLLEYWPSGQVRSCLALAGPIAAPAGRHDHRRVDHRAGLDAAGPSYRPGVAEDRGVVIKTAPSPATGTSPNSPPPRPSGPRSPSTRPNAWSAFRSACRRCPRGSAYLMTGGWCRWTGVLARRRFTWTSSAASCRGCSSSSTGKM